MSGTHPPVLRSERLTLRPPCPDDVEARFTLGADAEIHRMYGGSCEQFRPITREGAQQWVQGLARHDCAWMIDDGRLIGHVRLDRIDRTDRRAALAIGIEDPERLAKGLGSEAIGLVLDHAFDTMMLHRLSVRVVAYNARAIRAYQKCGFVIEGREREAAWVDGAWHDDVMMGILDHERARL